MATRYVYQLIARGSNDLGGRAEMASSTVFTSAEAAERRREKFVAMVTDRGRLLVAMSAERLTVEVKSLEIVED